MGLTINPCCRTPRSDPEEYLCEFWEGLRARRISSSEYIGRVYDLYEKEQKLSSDHWKIIVREFFYHSRDDFNLNHVEPFFTEIYNKYSINFVYLICALIFVFRIDKKDAIAAFNFAFTKINDNKKIWLIEKNNILSIDREEIRKVIEIYVEIISSVTIRYFSRQEEKLKQFSKIYDIIVQQTYINTIIVKEEIDKKYEPEYIRINDVFDNFYKDLSDSSVIRDKLTDIYFKLFEKKTRTYELSNRNTR